MQIWKQCRTPSGCSMHIHAPCVPVPCKALRRRVQPSAWSPTWHGGYRHIGMHSGRCSSRRASASSSAAAATGREAEADQSRAGTAEWPHTQGRPNTTIDPGAAARGMQWLAAQLCPKYQGLGEAEMEVLAALGKRGVVCVRAYASQQRSDMYRFSLPGHKQVASATAMAAALGLRKRPVHSMAAGMIRLAQLLRQRYAPPPGIPQLDSEQAVVEWLEGQGVVCTSDSVSIRTRYFFQIPAAKRKLTVNQVAAALHWAPKTPQDDEAGKTWALQQLRTKYQGPWLDTTAGMRVDEVWGVLERDHGVRYTCIQHMSKDNKQVAGVFLFDMNSNRQVSARWLAGHLGLSPKAQKQQIGQADALLHFAQHLHDKGYVEVQPGGGVVSMDVASWVGLLQARGLVFHARSLRANGSTRWMFSIQPGRQLEGFTMNAAALGLALPTELDGLAADQERGMSNMAVQLAGKYEELCEGAQEGEDTVTAAMQALQQGYGVQCLVYYRDKPKHHAVMGAYFIPAAHDAEARKQPPGSAQLPNNISRGRLVGTPDEVAEALGLTPVLLRRAREELVQLLRQGYVWPGVSSDAQGLAQLQQWGLNVRLKPRANLNPPGSALPHVTLWRKEGSGLEAQQLLGVAGVAKAMQLQRAPS